MANEQAAARRRRQAKQRKKNKDDRLRDRLQDLLGGLGLGGSGYAELIRKGVQNRWSSFEFERAVMRSRPFKRQFPGLVKGGGIASYFTDAGYNSLTEAVTAYNKYVDTAQDTLRNFGIKLTRDRIGALIAGEVSVEEMGTRLTAIATVDSNPELEAQFRDLMRANGVAKVNKTDLYRFAARQAPRQFYDFYEAAQFRQAGLDLSTDEALAAAQQIGQVGQPIGNLGELVSQVRLMKADVAPELARAGITDADLLQLSAGVDSRGLEPKLRQIVAQRRALQQTPQGGSQAQQGSGGGFALYEDDEAPSAL